MTISNNIQDVKNAKKEMLISSAKKTSEVKPKKIVQITMI